MPLALLRRRGDADEGQRKLSVRREEAEPGKGASPSWAPEQPIHPGRVDQGRLDAPAGAPLVPAAALERLAVEAGRMGGRPFLDMGLGRDLHVRLTRAATGVELSLTPSPGLRGAAFAELPGLVAALRARGVPVARAEVRSGAAGPRALTAPRPSATNAATSHPAGTVAKW